MLEFCDLSLRSLGGGSSAVINNTAEDAVHETHRITNETQTNAFYSFLSIIASSKTNSNHPTAWPLSHI